MILGDFTTVPYEMGRAKRWLALRQLNYRILKKSNCFYEDKTRFIKEWWENGDDITLLTRPRRFGKTLMLSVLEYFFSIKYTGKAGLFAHLAIWEEEEYRKLQGTYPVISLSFANIKEHYFENAKAKIGLMIANLYAEHYFLLDSGKLTEPDRIFFSKSIRRYG